MNDERSGLKKDFSQKIDFYDLTVKITKYFKR